MWGGETQEEELQVNQGLGVNVAQKPLTGWVTSLFVTVNYQTTGLHCVHFL